MENFRGWLKLPYGKKLRKLHAWNAWTVVLLAVTGIILYMPSLRGTIASFRVILKDAHIILGVLSIVIVLLYLPLIFKHVKQISKKRNQQFNLALILFLLTGWSVTGLILWQEQRFSESISTFSLILHDVFTWIGIPWAVFHSISRSRWLRKQPAHTNTNDVNHSRRQFLKWGMGLLILSFIGPSFYRFIKRVTDTGGSSIDRFVAEDGNRMLPPPAPHPDSLIPIGGGSEGQFRVYTVTSIPTFTSDNWTFDIHGLVDQPLHLSWDELLQIPRKTQISDFHCVTGWSVLHCTWEGIPLKDLLDKAGVKKAAKYVKFYSGDQVYTDALSLEQSNMEDVMVAILIDGKPLPQQLGGPVRLIVPKMYAYKSVKWLQSIELIDKDHIGYWQQRGYDTDAWIPGQGI